MGRPKDTLVILKPETSVTVETIGHRLVQLAPTVEAVVAVVFLKEDNKFILMHTDGSTTAQTDATVTILTADRHRGLQWNGE